MKLLCTRKKEAFKNLTVNKEYEAIEDGEAYVVTNDIGLRSKYAKGYFRVLPEAPTTRNLLDLLTVNFNEDNQVTITLNRTTRTVDLDINVSVISCGIDEIEGISNVKRIINELYANKMPDIIGTKTEMFHAILTEIFHELRDSDARMCWLLSDELRTSDEELDAVLDSISDTTSTGINPNNEHNIRLWVIK